MLKANSRPGELLFDCGETAVAARKDSLASPTLQIPDLINKLDALVLPAPADWSEMTNLNHPGT